MGYASDAGCESLSREFLQNRSVDDDFEHGSRETINIFAVAYWGEIMLLTQVGALSLETLSAPYADTLSEKKWGHRHDARISLVPTRLR